jgi:hypothetical protein
MAGTPWQSIKTNKPTGGSSNGLSLPKMDALDQIGHGQFRQALKTINNALDAFWLKVAIRFGGAS